MNIENVRWIETLKTLQSFVSQNPLAEIRRYLDFGCGDGTLTAIVAKALNCQEIYGVDFSPEELSKANIVGFHAYQADLNTGTLPFKDNEFDVVTAFDVIEHLWNTDNLISEAYRVLKPNGCIIITTPNLASWVNRLLLLFGYLPFHYECSLIKELDKRPLQRSTGVVETHVRLYTFKALANHIKSYGFKIVYLQRINLAYTSSNPIVNLFNKIFSLRKSLGAGIFLIATKQESDK
jgi:2-polyprenyl-3-methyl-5-hydroxy-6-metoxy-1,4-benzoquinol methylase